jgi:sulfur-carrier protein
MTTPMTTSAAHDAAGATVATSATVSTTASVEVSVRYFAAAAEAAGTTSERLDVVPGSAGGTVTADALRAAMVAAHGADLERVLTRCSLLADGVRVTADDPVPAGATVDVLPPFAGG